MKNVPAFLVSSYITTNFKPKVLFYQGLAFNIRTLIRQNNIVCDLQKLAKFKVSKSDRLCYSGWLQKNP